MLAIGGMPPNLGAEYFDKDAWPQGLGIFDLTEMQWKSTYDADAAPYKTPKQIKDHIAANGTYPSSWNDDVIERWITGRGELVFSFTGNVLTIGSINDTAELNLAVVPGQ